MLQSLIADVRSVIRARRFAFAAFLIVPFALFGATAIAAAKSPVDVRETSIDEIETSVGENGASEEGVVRYSFAETYIGLDGSSRGGRFQPALSIGGTHFWGAADIYVRFPLGTVATGKGDFTPGIETSLHWYPLPLEKDSLRPYIGAGWTVAGYGRPDGPSVARHWFPLKAGISWRNQSHLFELGLSWLAGEGIHYPLDTQGGFTQVDDVPRLAASFGYKYVFDTTLHAAARYKAEQASAQLHGQAGELDNWGVIASPSSVFPLGRGKLPEYMDGYPPTVTYELGLSRYFYKPDVSLQAIYRPVNTSQTAFGDHVTLYGHSLRLEGLKFMPMDYHGFVPFVGFGIGYEHWNNNRASDDLEKAAGWAPSFSFGWEIRPTRLEKFYLRQSMRYTAARMVGAPADIFDVSFIQFVYYFDR